MLVKNHYSLDKKMHVVLFFWYKKNWTSKKTKQKKNLLFLLV